MDDLIAPKIVNGNSGDLEAIVETLADSFHHDPILNWVLPAPALYPRFFRLLLHQVFLPRGIVHRDFEDRGAALWLPPGQKFEIPPQLATLDLLARLTAARGPVPLWRIYRQGALFARHHPQQPHFYLQFIGARRSCQGRGIGAALLKQGTRLCDQHHMPAYLESSNERNLPLYQRHGFEVLREESLPGNGPRAWFMWREAR